MKNKESTSKRRSQQDYNLGFKVAVISQVEKGEFTYKQAQKAYGIQGGEHPQQRHFKPAAGIRRKAQILAAHDAHLIVELHILGARLLRQCGARGAVLFVGGRCIGHHLGDGDALQLLTRLRTHFQN